MYFLEKKEKNLTVYPNPRKITERLQRVFLNAAVRRCALEDSSPCRSLKKGVGGRDGKGGFQSGRGGKSSPKKLRFMLDSDGE